MENKDNNSGSENFKNLFRIIFMIFLLIILLGIFFKEEKDEDKIIKLKEIEEKKKQLRIVEKRITELEINKFKDENNKNKKRFIRRSYI